MKKYKNRNIHSVEKIVIRNEEKNDINKKARFIVENLDMSKEDLLRPTNIKLTNRFVIESIFALTSKVNKLIGENENA